MKQILGILLIVVILGFSTAYFLSPVFAQKVTDAVSFSHCDSPTRFKIGTIDDRFAITREELIPVVTNAANAWNDAYGKDIFLYDQEKGDLTVSLTFDERQALTNQIGNLNKELENEKNEIDPQIAEFERRVNAFKRRVSDFNRTIEEWNRKGGAPEGEFEKLQKEQESLQSEQNELDALARQLNQSTNEYNTQVGQLNQTIDSFNKTLQTRPEEGLYNGADNTITIFFMASRDELLHTLTHEFGHAVGIGHLDNENAIMFYQTNTQLSLTNEDREALREVCREKTVFEITGERVVYLGQLIEQTFQKYQLIP